MAGKILPYFIQQSKEKLTDRGGLALVDEFLTGIGFSRQLSEVFPLPGSGRGIPAVDYVRTLVYHFVDGGRPRPKPTYWKPFNIPKPCYQPMNA